MGCGSFSKSAWHDYAMRTNLSRASTTGSRGSIYSASSLNPELDPKNISKDVKPSIAEWYNTGSTDNPFDNLDKWDNALTNAYGKRRFTKMEINENEIYAG